MPLIQAPLRHCFRAFLLANLLALLGVVTPPAVRTCVAADSTLSSPAKAGLAGQYTVGYADATEMNTVASGNVELLYTLTGDSRLTGSVNFLDYSIMQNNYNQTGRDWAQGDWNHDGTVNFLDYSLLQNSYNQSVPAAVFSAAKISGAAAPAGAAAVSAAAMPVDDLADAVYSLFDPVSDQQLFA